MRHTTALRVPHPDWGPRPVRCANRGDKGDAGDPGGVEQEFHIGTTLRATIANYRNLTTFQV
jgi:hypothetical protein